MRVKNSLLTQSIIGSYCISLRKLKGKDPRLTAIIQTLRNSDGVRKTLILSGTLNQNIKSGLVIFKLHSLFSFINSLLKTDVVTLYNTLI